jgi:hypothetical protein
MQMKCRIIAGIMLMAFFTLTPLVEAAPQVPENVYQWVQSSARANYYFNKQQICYAVTDMGYTDLNTLIVPVLKVYDDVQIQDVLDKRRWKMLPMDGYNDLIGEADYLRFDLAKNTVTVTELDYLDSTWSALDASYPNQPIEIGTLPEKSQERNFYQSILSYAKQHRDEIIQQTKGTLSPVDTKRLADEKKAALKTDKMKIQKDKQK